jgi:hypothetical protein
MESLRQRGMAETDPIMLQLRLQALNCRIGIDEPAQIHLDMLDLLLLVEKYGDPELLFWTYERLGGITYDTFGNLQVMIALWEKGFQAVLQTDNERLIKVAEAMELTFRVETGMAADNALARLLEMLAYFEKDFPQSATVFALLRATSYHYSATNAFEPAISYGKRCLSVAKGWRDLFWISLATDRLADIYLQMGQPGQAGAQHLDALEWHLAVGQVWQTLGNIWAKCVFNPQLLGGMETAVSFLAMIYYHPEVVPFHRTQIEDARPQLEEEMGAEAFAAAWEKGRGLDFDTAVGQVRAALSADEKQ